MKRHPDKSIRAAVRYALGKGWRFVAAGRSAHIWGKLYCPESSRRGCKFFVQSTPQNAEDHAKAIVKMVDGCAHNDTGSEESSDG